MSCHVHCSLLVIGSADRRVAGKASSGHLCVWEIDDGHESPIVDTIGGVIADGRSSKNEQPQPHVATAQPAAPNEGGLVTARAARLLWTVRVPGAATRPHAHTSRLLLGSCQDGAYVCCGGCVRGRG
jgi:hypothetical protein